VREARLGQVVSKAVVVATGITASGGREVLGLAVGDSEEETFWRAFLTDLRGRDLPFVVGTPAVSPAARRSTSHRPPATGGCT
jgi:transposase-like protein